MPKINLLSEKWLKSSLLLTLATFLTFKTFWFFSFKAKYEQTQEFDQLMRQAYLADGKASNNDWNVLKPFTKPEAQEIVRKALRKIQHVIAQDPSDVELYRMLGRAALLAGDKKDAVSAFSYAARLRPNSPMIWLELGYAYASFLSFDHHSQSLDWHSPSLPYQNWHWTSTVPKKYHWWLPNSPEITPPWWEPAKPVKRTVVQANNIRLLVMLPTTPTELVFWMGSPQNTSEEQDTIYQVQIDDDEKTVYSFVATTQLHWYPARVDMSRWLGQTINLTLKVNNPQAGWGDIAFVRADEVACAMVDCWQRAVAAWKEAGFAVSDMIRAGEQAFEAEQYDEALLWYERASLFNQYRSDILYKAGYVLEAASQPLKALTLYHQAIRLNQFDHVPVSTVFLRIGDIYQRQLDTPNYELAIWAYNQALFHNDFGDDAERAHCHYRIGETLWWQGEVGRSISHWETAVSIYPHHYWVHIRLGEAYYETYQDLQTSEKELLKAIALEPQNKWGYYYLGEIYRRSGLLGRAIMMYQRMLEIEYTNYRKKFSQ